ncbi:MAG: L,D-transpeptidase family protein, partial [Coriobacteriaceae bacterium]|nr:L,D-transpeptidase family protein [Coriobacteriaceae bacterium]
MFSKLGRVIVSLVLCLSLVPAVGVAAWADEGDTVANQIGGAESAFNDEGLGDEGEGALGGDGIAGDTQGDEGGKIADQVRNDEDIFADESDEATDEDAIELNPTAASCSVQYRAHSASLGWRSWVKDGAVAGTTGRSLRLEALSLRLVDPDYKGAISYRAYVAGLGWQDAVKNGAVAGTTGQYRQMEAVEISLTDEMAEHYNIYYRAHVAGLGWLGWAKNGEIAGTTGYDRRMEAIEVRLIKKGSSTVPSSSGDASKIKPMTVQARAHSASVGWRSWVDAGSVAGTTGRSLRLEALNLRLINPNYEGGITYRAHVAGIGWQGWKSNAATAGTTGQYRQIEAVEIRLTGEMAKHYDLYYCAHAAGFGWLGWAKNGETAGTAGIFCRMEAIKLKLVKKDGAAPGSLDKHAVSIDFSATAKVAGKDDWLSPVRAGLSAGTTGQSRQMEAFMLTAKSEAFPSGGIEYRAHVAGPGWQGWKKNGALAGTEGENRRIEAIQIRLTGDLAKYFDVYYRAHSAKFGWMGWAKNGASAGTAKLSLRLEAFQVILVYKGGPAPGSTAGAYREKPPAPPTHEAMHKRVANVSSPTNWLIAIDSSNCLVGVYYGSKGNWTNKYMWLCSPGARATPTVKGLFSIGSRGYVFGSGFSCYYWTQFYGNYLFHSVLYYPGTRTIMEGVMGVPASHGCVRLDINNAKWIYDNIP